MKVIIYYNDKTYKYEILEYINSTTFRFLKEYKSLTRCYNYIHKNDLELISYQVNRRYN